MQIVTFRPCSTRPWRALEYRWSTAFPRPAATPTPWPTPSGEANDLLVVELDVTSLASAEAAVQAAVDRFARIDVLLNNAGNFHAGFFEELTPEQIERQLTTSLVGR